jgi:hypothetical protein
MRFKGDFMGFSGIFTINDGDSSPFVYPLATQRMYTIFLGMNDEHG